jgi:hypothetical protein
VNLELGALVDQIYICTVCIQSVTSVRVGLSLPTCREDRRHSLVEGLQLVVGRSHPAARYTV